MSNIERFASRLFKPGELIEYRAKLASDGSMRGFYFTDLQRYAEVVATLDGDGRAAVSYICINPLKGRLVRERQLIVNPTDEQVNQIIAGPPGKTASNDDIDILRWIFIDVDTVRAPHLAATDKAAFDALQHGCATNEEKAASKQVALQVVTYLRSEKGWPQPIICDSGNGWHILFRMDMQNTATNYHNHGDVLKTLKSKFDGSVAEIDSTVYNPARLTRAYGSTTRKGTDAPERPYRPNRMFESKEPVGTVTLDQILGLIVDAPGSLRKSDSDMPEVDPKFDLQAFFRHYESQGAFHIEGEKEWQGHPIYATDVCLFQGHKHSGDEYKSGFVYGDTFGYKCFSSDCDGLTLKDVFQKLREAVDDQGNPLYTPYPDVIFKTEALEEVLKDFANDVSLAEDALETEKAEQSIDAPPKPEPEVEGELDINKKRLKIGTVVDTAGFMVSSLMRDPVKNLPKFARLKSHIEHTLTAHTEAPIHEVLVGIAGYYEETRLVPSHNEFINWLEDSTYSTARTIRSKEWFPEVLKYVRELKDDPSKEFTVQVTELNRAVELEWQRKTTRANWHEFLQKGQDVQGFRNAERQHALKDLRSSGEILSGPMQLVTEEIAEEFRKDFEGANDAWRFNTGVEAIDLNSHVGLGGERTIAVYGANNSFKTTMVLTIAIQAAREGKNVLILVGEHQALPMMKALVLMIGHFVREDSDIGMLPSKFDIEGVNRNVTEEDWRRIRLLLDKIREMEVLPGYLGVQNISALAQMDEDRLGAVIDYIHSFNMEYPLDAVVIDPLSQVMPLSAMSKENAWAEGTEVLQRIQNLSRTFEGRSGRGLMIITSAQFTSKFQREIEKEQAKNASQMDQQDDKLLSLLTQASQVQFFTTMPQDLDCCIGVVTRVKGGREGYIVRGRFRFGSTFQSVTFTADPISNVIVAGANPTLMVATAAAGVGASTSPSAGSSETIGPVDVL